MKRRCLWLALFLLPWLIVLAVPSLRWLFWVQVRGSEYHYAYPYLAPFTPLEGWLRPPAPTRAELARRYPGNVAAQLKALEQKTATYNDEGISLGMALRRYDQLLTQHPQTPWLIAGRVRLGMIAFWDGRTAGDLEVLSEGDAGYYASWPVIGRGVQRELNPNDESEHDSAAFVPSSSPAPLVILPGVVPSSAPGRPNGKANRRARFDPQQVQRVQRLTALAERGRKLEPDNCFWDWSLAYLHFALRHDAPALAALHAGAHKPRYDSHLSDEVRAAIETGELGRPLLIEERLAIAREQLDAGWSRRDHMARLALWPGVRAEVAGDATRALDIYGDVSRIGARMWTAGVLRQERSEGAALLKMTWAGRLNRISGGRRLAFKGRGTTTGVAQRFIHYADRHGRHDLAQAAARQAQELDQWQAQRYRIGSGSYQTPGLPRAVLEPILNLAFLNGATLVQLQIALLAWLTVSLLLWRRLRWARRLARWGWHGANWLWRNPGETPVPLALPPVPPHNRRDLWKSAGLGLLCAGVSGVVLVRHSPLTVQWYGGYGETDNSAWPVVAAMIYLAAPLACSLLWCGGATLWRHRVPRALSVAAHQEERGAPPSILPRLSAFFVWMLTGYAAIAWALLWLTPYWTQTFGSSDTLALPAPPFCGEPLRLAVNDVGLPLFLSAVALNGWLLKWCWQMPSGRRVEAARFGLLWLRQLMATWLVIGSVVYLLAALTSLPARREADRQFDRFLQQGEMALLRAQEARQ